MMVILQILGKLRGGNGVNSVIGTHTIPFGPIKPKPYHKSVILILPAQTSKVKSRKVII